MRDVISQKHWVTMETGNSFKDIYVIVTFQSRLECTSKKNVHHFVTQCKCLYTFKLKYIGEDTFEVIHVLEYSF